LLDSLLLQTLSQGLAMFVTRCTIHCSVCAAAAAPAAAASAVIGEVDEDLYDSLDLANMRAPPLRAIKH
jgi:hypothetical protein